MAETAAPGSGRSPKLAPAMQGNARFCIHFIIFTSENYLSTLPGYFKRLNNYSLQTHLTTKLLVLT